MADFLYTRASTNETKQDLKTQLQLAIKYNIKPECVFSEFESGGKRNRKEYNRMLSIVQTGDTIIARDIMRLSRSLKDILELISIVKDKKLRLILDSMNFTLDCRGKWSIFEEICILVFGLVGEIQRTTISTDTKEKLAYKRDVEGVVLGAPVLTKERLLIKKPEILELYGLYKTKIISFESFKLALKVSRNTAYSYIKIIESA